MKRKTKLLIRDAFLSTILSCIFLAILSITFVNIRFFNPLHKVFKDFSFLDVYYAEQFEESTSISEDIVLVNIENHGRDGIAMLLEAVLKEDPKVVGFDVILRKHKTHNEADSLLRTLLKKKKVINAFEIDNDGLIIENESFFNTTKEPAFTNFNFIKDNDVIREFRGKKVINNKERLSFATMIAKNYLKNKSWKKYDYDRKLEDLQYIKYHGNVDKFPVLTLKDFLLSDSKRFIKDKIVIMGYLGSSETDTQNDINDKFWTPLNNRMAGKSDRDMYGAVVHANIVRMLIKNDLIFKVSYLWLGIITFIAMFFSTMLYMKLNKNFKISFRTRKQTYQLIFSAALLVISFWLLKKDIAFSPFFIILGVLMAGSYFKYYKHLTRYIKTKRKWKTYLK